MSEILKRFCDAPDGMGRFSTYVWPNIITLGAKHVAILLHNNYNLSNREISDCTIREYRCVIAKF